MKTTYLRVDGLYCSHCVSTIKSILKKEKNIKEITVNKNIFTITYKDFLNKDQIIKEILNSGYITKEEYFSDNLISLKTVATIKEFLVITTIIILIFLGLYKILGVNIFNLIPNIDSKVTYSMLFLTGLLTSIHCISMCGSINLLASINNYKNKNILKPILYNLGRLVSYTALGGVVGLLGSLININSQVASIITIIASILMILVSLNMLGVINIKKIKIASKLKIPNNPFLLGLLNAFMPCGPMQSMQLYALATGSVLKGALSMFLFCLGTIPLMLSFGLIFNLFKGKFKIIINKIAISLMFILAIIMFNRGLLGLGIDLTNPKKDYANYLPATIKEDYQEINFSLSYDSYANIIVKENIPVKMIIHVDEKYLTGCNNEIVINEFGVKETLHVGDNTITFVPNKEGVFTITCWMNMIKNTILVTNDESYFEGGV